VLADELVISDLVTQATAIVTKLQALINAVKPDASDIDLAPISGMSATNVQSGISELKGTLDNLDGLKTVTNLNTITTSGVYKYDGGSTGAPTANGGVVLTIYNLSSNQAVQIAQANNQSYTSIRRKHADWTAWNIIALESSLAKFKQTYRDITQPAGNDNWSLTVPASISGYTKLIVGVNVIALDSLGRNCFVKSYKIDSDTAITVYVENLSSSSVDIRIMANILFMPNSQEI
jgi:hypothetical protein